VARRSLDDRQQFALDCRYFRNGPLGATLRTAGVIRLLLGNGASTVSLDVDAFFSHFVGDART
jgi:hypothetical protein